MQILSGNLCVRGNKVSRPISHLHVGIPTGRDAEGRGNAGMKTGCFIDQQHRLVALCCLSVVSTSNFPSLLQQHNNKQPAKTQILVPALGNCIIPSRSGRLIAALFIECGDPWVSDLVSRLVQPFSPLHVIRAASRDPPCFQLIEVDLQINIERRVRASKAEFFVALAVNRISFA